MSDLLEYFGMSLNPETNKDMLKSCEVQQINIGEKVRINEPGNLLDGYTGTLERVENEESWVLVAGWPVNKVQTINLVKAGK